jgi:hypothetical protein
MKKRGSTIQYLALSVVFIAVSLAVYFKNIPRTVDFIGILVCGFVAGTLFQKGISLLKKN